MWEAYNIIYNLISNTMQLIDAQDTLSFFASLLQFCSISVGLSTLVSFILLLLK